MKRQILRLGLALVCACSSLSGCELLDHEKRSKSNDAVHEREHEDGADKVGAVESAPPKGFFSGSRLPGGLSSESREVERNLGIP
jgi:hypothetical protein